MWGIAYMVNGRITGWANDWDTGRDMVWDTRDEALAAHEAMGWRGWVREYAPMTPEDVALVEEMRRQMTESKRAEMVQALTRGLPDEVVLDMWDAMRRR